MKNLNRPLSLMLAIAMLLCALPMTVLASNNVLTGISAHLYSVSAENTISDAGVTALGAVDTIGVKCTETLNTSLKWYYMYYNEFEIPESETGFERYDFESDEPGNYVFVKPVASNTENFDPNREYLCEVTITPPAGTSISEDANIFPAYADIKEMSTDKAVLALTVTPSETKQMVKDLPLYVDDTGYVTLPELPNGNYVYAYKCIDGAYDPLVFNNPINTPVGHTVINTSDYQLLTDNTIAITNPQIVIVMVETYEWNSRGAAAVHGYGITALKLTDPIVTVDNLEIGSPINVSAFGSQTLGNYNINIASASFDGWFVDENATTPATSDGESYAVFDLRYSGLFPETLAASDIQLKYGDEIYLGAKIISIDSYTTLRVSFLIPSDRVQIAVNTTTSGGTAFFQDCPDEPSMSITPDFWGNYPTIWVTTLAEPGYYLKSVKVNGTPVTLELPILDLNPNQPYEFTVGVQCTANSVITVEFEPADVIIPVIPEGFKHSTFDDLFRTKYYVAQCYDTYLCATGAISDSAYSMYSIEWNTEPDGSGIALKNFDGKAIWSGNNPYNNGKADVINIYPIMCCNAHILGNDTTEWIKVPASDVKCGENGYIEHEKCPTCGICKVVYDVENGYWNLVTPSEVTIESRPHEMSKPVDNHDGTHTTTCVNCNDSTISAHEFINGVCVCGAEEGPAYIKGDVNNDGEVTDADATYLLFYTIFPDDYPVEQPADYNGDGEITDADATYLLFYTIFPDDYPLD